MSKSLNERIKHLESLIKPVNDEPKTIIISFDESTGLFDVNEFYVDRNKEKPKQIKVKKKSFKTLEEYKKNPPPIGKNTTVIYGDWNIE